MTMGAAHPLATRNAAMLLNEHSAHPVLLFRRLLSSSTSRLNTRKNVMSDVHDALLSSVSRNGIELRRRAVERIRKTFSNGDGIVREERKTE